MKRHCRRRNNENNPPLNTDQRLLVISTLPRQETRKGQHASVRILPAPPPSQFHKLIINDVLYLSSQALLTGIVRTIPSTATTAASRFPTIPLHSTIETQVGGWGKLRQVAGVLESTPRLLTDGVGGEGKRAGGRAGGENKKKERNNGPKGEGSRRERENKRKKEGEQEIIPGYTGGQTANGSRGHLYIEQRRCDF